jgi:hypothetical protein
VFSAKKQENTGVRQPRTHLLRVDARETPADIEAKRNRLITAGRAPPRRHIRARALEKTGRNLK